jgi:hypothetical protein
MLTIVSIFGLFGLVWVWCSKWYILWKIITTVALFVVWFFALMLHCVRESERNARNSGINPVIENKK